MIARDLLVTAKHCVFEAGPAGDRPAEVAGMRVGFGMNEGSLIEREVDRLAWVGMPESGSIESAVLAGEDVAVLHLSEAAPASETVRDIVQVFEPTDRQLVRVAGFGVTDLETGASGVRTVSEARVSGFDPTTGIIALSGPGVCFGDSGGPVLSEDDATILAVVGQVGAVDGGFCSDGVSFADSAANIGVRRLLAKECARVGGCGAPAPSSLPGESAGAAGSDASGAGGSADRLPEIGAGESGMSASGSGGSSASDNDSRGSGWSCQVSNDSAGRTSHAPYPLGIMAAFFVAGFLGRRSRRVGDTK